MIPERYKNLGFTKVGQKKQSTSPGKKWMVLAKKGDSYKIVHGGDKSMKDFSQHGSEERRKNFWNRMGGKNSAKAKDPFSPLYWHKRFGTWAYGGDTTEGDVWDIYDPKYKSGKWLIDSEQPIIGPVTQKEWEDQNPFQVTGVEGPSESKFSRWESAGTGKDFHPYFKAFNTAAQFITGLATLASDAKNRRRDQEEYIKSITPKPKPNYNEDGLNNIPMYENGGDTYTGLSELEQGEVYKDVNGTITKIHDHAPKHEDGGVVVNDAHKILEDTSDKRKDKSSKELLMSADDIFNLTGVSVNKSMTHSKAFEKVSEHFDKYATKLQNKIEKNLSNVKKSTSQLSENALDFNMKELSSIPDKESLFDIIFNHQETVKKITGISKESNEFRTGGKTPYKEKPEGYGDTEKLQEYIRKYNEFNGTNFTTIGEIQKHRGENYPGLVYDYYREQGTPPTNKHAKLLGQEEIDFQNVPGNTILEGDQDNMWGVRQILPQKKQFTTTQEWKDYTSGKNVIVGADGREFVYDGDNIYTTPEFVDATTPKSPEFVDATTPKSPEPINNTDGNQVIQKELEKIVTSDKKKRFNQKLEWYDVAGALENLIDSDRIPVRYDAPELTFSGVKYINPKPQLQSATQSYNALISRLPNSGIGLSNTANIFSSKYNIDNQVLGQTENANTQLYNQQNRYEDQMRNQQSMMDYQARQMFERKYLTSLENQRRQRALSKGDLYDTLQKNRRLNNEGDLLMQMFDFYNQDGTRNNNPFVFQDRSSNPSQNIVSDNSGQKYYIDPTTGKLTKLTK